MFQKNFLQRKVIIFWFPISVASYFYDYEIFENFELTKDVFIKEQKLIKELERIRTYLYQKKNSAIQNMYDYNGYGLWLWLITNGVKIENIHLQLPDAMPSNKKLNVKKTNVLHNIVFQRLASNQPLLFIPDGKYWIERIKNIDYLNLNHNMSTERIIRGSLKGILMIYETYDLDIKQFSRGHFNFRNGIENNSRQIDCLHAGDLAMMSTIAMDVQWYDTSIKCLKESIYLYGHQFSDIKEAYDRLPLDFNRTLLSKKKAYSSYHNRLLIDKQKSLGTNWKLFPYVIDEETLEKTRNQPEQLKGMDLESKFDFYTVDGVKGIKLQGEYEEEYFRQICNGKIKGNGTLMGVGIPEFTHPNRVKKCHYVHHFDPFLNLGPFRLEVMLYWPFRTIIHEFFTDYEMNWIKNYARPKLSGTRIVPESTQSMTKAERKGSIRSVAKTVQTWFDEVKYTTVEEPVYLGIDNELLNYEFIPGDDPYNFTLEHSVMLGVSKKMELATHFNLTSRYGASRYQVTNYGLGGFCEVHHDAWGYEQGVKLVRDRQYLVFTGDYIATFLGWLDDVSGGGETAFLLGDAEGVLEPKKGSATFFIDLSSSHIKENLQTHAGCPILKGSKWILNKWINSFDQWMRWPCDLNEHLSIKPFAGMSH